MKPLNPEGADRLQQMGGRAFLLRMIDVYLEDTPGRVAEVRNSRDRHDLESLGRAAHGLVSNSVRLGAEDLGSVARQIEEAARTQKPDRAFALVGELEAEFDHACRLLRELRAEAESP